MFDSLSKPLPSAIDIVQLLSEPLMAVTNPGQRIYWVFLLSSACLISLVLLKNSVPRAGLASRISAYLRQSSHLIDIGLWCLNLLIKSFILLPLLVSHLSATILVSGFLQSSFGDGPNISLNITAVMTLFTLCYFICDDGSRFLLHYALHKFPLLWHFHKVHHSASVLSPLTVYRLHPIEMTLYTLRQLITVAIISGIFLWLFEGKITGWAILGVDAAGFIFNLVGANLRHSHIWLGFGPFERWLISPAMHQIHHSRLPEHRDKNFGSALSIWDKLLNSRTLSNTVNISSGQVSQLPFGLETSTHSAVSNELASKITRKVAIKETTKVNNTFTKAVPIVVKTAR